MRSIEEFYSWKQHLSLLPKCRAGRGHDYLWSTRAERGSSDLVLNNSQLTSHDGFPLDSLPILVIP